jgi:DNA-directed RNA polymerase specialized sigma24 family protein
MRKRPQGEPVAADQSRALDEMPAVSVEPADPPAVPIEVYHRLYERVLATGRRMGMDTARAKEVAHDEAADEWIRQNKKGGGFDWKGAGGWAWRAARGALGKRRRYAQSHSDLPRDSDPQARDATIADVESTLDAADILRLYEREIATWPERRRIAFLLTRKGLTYPQAAAELGVSLSAIQWYHKVAYQRLRIVLADYNPSAPQAAQTKQSQGRET